jgi:hypothetical protein
MGHANPFQTFTFQDLSNDIKNSSNHWVLTPVIALWKFENPPGLHLPKWELSWECEGSFPHTFLHSWECEGSFPHTFLHSWECEGSFPHTFLHSWKHVVWLPGFLLACNLTSPFALIVSPRLRLRHLWKPPYIPKSQANHPLISGRNILKSKLHNQPNKCAQISDECSLIPIFIYLF